MKPSPIVQMTIYHCDIRINQVIHNSFSHWLVLDVDPVNTTASIMTCYTFTPSKYKFILKIQITMIKFRAFRHLHPQTQNTVIAWVVYAFVILFLIAYYFLSKI